MDSSVFSFSKINNSFLILFSLGMKIYGEGLPMNTTKIGPP